jgi:hypothetical protein
MLIVQKLVELVFAPRIAEEMVLDPSKLHEIRMIYLRLADT